MKIRFLYTILFIINAFVIFGQEMYIFYDDFESNKGKWLVANNSDASGKITGGKYIMEHKRNFSVYYYWNEKVFDPKSDYTIEVKIKQTKGSGTDKFGIVWGASGWDNSYSFLLSSDGTYTIGGYKDKSEFTRMEYSRPSVILPKGNYNVLAVKRVGSIIKFYINQKSVYQCSAEPFFGYLLGFVVGKNMEIEADYFSITFPKPVINLVNDLNPAYKKKNLGQKINSVYSEIAPVISPDGQTLYVARQNHPSNEGAAKMYDVWFATRKNDGSWTELQRMGKPINNEGDNLVISVSPDGNTLLLEGLYASDGSYISDQGISISHKTSSGWSMPKKVVIQDFYNLNEFESYCPTVDRNVLIMSVERKDTYGQKDLYVSFKQANGEYSKPLNMGSDINTYLNEGTPFIAPDNKTLYFYSYGHPGYGSADIFVTKRLDDTWTKWSKPKNLGPNINSSDWDTYYSISAKGDYAYLVSSRNSFGNEDVFEIKLSEESRPDPVVLIYGRVFNSKTKKPVGVDIIYEDLKSGLKSGDAKSNPGNGTYKIILPYGKSYGFRAEADNYMAVNEEIDLSKISSYKEIKRDLYLVPIEAGSMINMQSVQFERNTDVFIESSHRELDRMVEIMKKYPKMEIELSGHTDTRGNPQLLLQLSSKRVIAVKDYLIKHGISASRITAKGYGGSRPLGTGSEEIESKNRRVEFKIIKM
jgi:outer membrane protein OmpA-like peptidoglycan-associated protein